MSDSETPWTVAHQVPLSMGFSRQKYWRRLLFPSPGDLPDPGIGPASPTSSASQADSLLLSHQGSPSKGFGNQEVRNRGKASDCELGVLCRLPAKHRDRPQNAGSWRPGAGDLELAEGGHWLPPSNFREGLEGGGCSGDICLEIYETLQ